MTKNLLNVLCLSFFILLFSPAFRARATHVTGADISYRWVSGNTFQIQLSVYRECSSPVAIAPVQKVYYSSFTCKPTQDSVVMVLDGPPHDVSPVCKREPSTCNGGTNPGIQRYRFKGTVTLPARCPDWVFYFRECNRSAGIGTLINPQNSCLYVEARLNNLLAPQNSSPQISNDPVSYLCVGQQANLNPGAIDANGDVLKFQLVTPRTNSIIPNVADINVVQFKPGFTAATPLPSQGSFLFDSTTGQIAFTPSQQITGVTAIKISEYRNGRLIGSIMQDLQMLVRDCSNGSPTLSGFDGGTEFTRLVCIGDSLSTTFTASDINPTDSVWVRWNAPFSGAVLIADSARGLSNVSLKWFPSLADTGIKTFTLTAIDNHCPSFGTTIQSYKLYVRQKPTIRTTADTLIACGDTIPISATVLAGHAPYVYGWAGRPETTQTILAGHGVYPVQVTDNTGCTANDTIELKGSSISASIRLDTACVVEGLQLSPVISSATSSLTYTYLWRIPAYNETYTTEVLRRSFEEEAVITVSLKVTASDNCTYTTSRPVRICPPPPVLARYAPNVCLGDPFRIGCGIPGRGGMCGADKICIYLTGRNWQQFSQNGIITLPADSLRPDSNSFMVVTTSISSCTALKHFKFKVKGKPKVNVFPGTSQVRYNCNRPDTSFVVRIYKDIRFITDTIWGQITMPDTVIKLPKTVQDTIYYTLHLNKPGLVTITGIMGGTCFDNKFINYAVGIQANVGVMNNCQPSDTVQLLPNHVSSGATYSLLDLGNGSSISPAKDTSLVYAPSQYLTGRLILGDQYGCFDTASFTINTLFPDTTVLVSADTICFLEKIKIRVFDSLNVYKWRFETDNIIQEWPIGKRLDSVAYLSPGPKPIKVGMWYKNNCYSTWNLPPVWVRPPIQTASGLTNVCAYDSSRFTGSVTFSEKPIQSWRWQYYYPAGINLPFNSDTVQNPVRKFGYNGSFRSILSAIDSRGCMGRDTLDSNMVMISKPAFDVNGNCQNDSLVFFFGRVPDQFETIEWFTYLYNDGTTETTSNGQGLHQFAAPGIYKIRLIATSTEGCTNSDSTTIDIKPRPTAVFEMPPPEICKGQRFKVSGHLSQPATAQEKITSYVWATSETNPFSADTATEIFITEDGPAYIALQVKSENGCQDYLKKSFQVRPRPVPDFRANEEDLLHSDLISFEDKSTGATAWVWDFGDGTTLNINNAANSSPQHKYTTGTTFEVEQWAVNEYGCADSIRKEINLKSFIALPKAFSPNGDDRNDGCGLIHRYIRSLDEFKIYNRLGQVVFDAGNNLDARWNGTLEGVNQPNGNYLYVARARSVFGENLELKGNITLIR